MELQDAMALREDELHVHIARELLGGGPGMGPFDRARLRQFGREQYELAAEGVRYNLCTEEGTPKIQAPDAVLAAFALIVEGTSSERLSIFFTALALQGGLEQFCRRS
jgi:hypothetical protein